MEHSAACLGLLLAGLSLGSAGCGSRPPDVPASPAEYDRLRSGGGITYPAHTVLLYNLQRVLDPDVPLPARMTSLELVERLGGQELPVQQELADVLSIESTPPELRRAVLGILLRQDRPDLGTYVVHVLPRLSSESPLRRAILGWLEKHPRPEVLAEVVKLWAREAGKEGSIEARYRRVVERLSGSSWDAALLEGLNAPGFFARGSALEILARRIPAPDLRRRIARLSPRSDAVAAIQTFGRRFDYLPENGEQLLATVWLHQRRRHLIDDAARLYLRWEQNSGYEFDVRDFHLLSRLARDPLRTGLGRGKLMLELGAAAERQRHVRSDPPARGRVVDRSRFWQEAEGLALAELWTLYLLDEMLRREGVQRALRVMAMRDLEDTDRAWGGLILYRNGRAEAILYPAPSSAPRNDLIYAPSGRARRDARDALCRFHAHFEKVNNARRAGPGAEELRAARRENFRALLLTRLSDEAFCAHYYNEKGTVISLGIFPLR